MNLVLGHLDWNYSSNPVFHSHVRNNNKVSTDSCPEPCAHCSSNVSNTSRFKSSSRGLPFRATSDLCAVDRAMDLIGAKHGSTIHGRLEPFTFDHVCRLAVNMIRVGSKLVSFGLR